MKQIQLAAFNMLGLHDNYCSIYAMSDFNFTVTAMSEMGQYIS